MVARKIRRRRCVRVGKRRVCGSGKLAGKALMAFRRAHPRIKSGANKGQFKRK